LEPRLEKIQYKTRQTFQIWVDMTNYIQQQKKRFAGEVINFSVFHAFKSRKVPFQMSLSDSQGWTDDEQMR